MEYSIEKIVKNIKILCKAKKISLCNLEKEIGVNQGYFSRINEDMKGRKIYLTANALGVTVNDLIEKDCEIIGLDFEIERLTELKNKLSES